MSAAEEDDEKKTPHFYTVSCLWVWWQVKADMQSRDATDDM